MPEIPVPETPEPEKPTPETPKPETPEPETPTPETPKPEIPEPEKPGPVTPPSSGKPSLLRVDAAAYLNNQNAAVHMFDHSRTDRLGEPGFGARGKGARARSGYVHSEIILMLAWLASSYRSRRI